jgi:H+-translocating NAD(P) transhydrogenase subunit alpha
MTEAVQAVAQVAQADPKLILYSIYIFMLAVFVGFEVISKVPVQLHTPLMSGTNAIHGIVMLGGMLVLAEAETPLLTWLGFAAVVLGAMNLFGGFVVTDRMLEMFKTKKPAPGRKP